jgi:multiple sugar transport system ATP-binding protein
MLGPHADHHFAALGDFGADTQIFCKLAGVDVTAVVRERHAFRPGEPVRLKPQLTFIFDPASGTRLA